MKILGIKNCDECAYPRIGLCALMYRKGREQAFSEYECRSDTIPEWCPLPDFPDNSQEFTTVHTEFTKRGGDADPKE